MNSKHTKNLFTRVLVVQQQFHICENPDIIAFLYLRHFHIQHIYK